MQTIEISEEVLRKIEDLCREGGYDSLDAWLEAAVDSQLTTLRLSKAEKIAGRVSEGLRERGHTEDEILKDFEVFRERLRGDGDPA